MANKIHKTIVDQLALLKSRGMIFNDESTASGLLQNISYYRLKGYWWDMQSDRVNHQFFPNTIFEDVIDRYNFDRHLRLILFDAIERIEIGLRTKMVYHLSEEFGPLWYMNRLIVNDAKLHQTHLADLQGEFARSQEIFAINHRNNKVNEDPDVWLILEVASMGTLSKMYKNLHHQLPQKSKIANEMGLNLQNELSSWLEAITYTRNIVAHHSRLWSRNMVRKPMKIVNPPFKWLKTLLTPVQEKKVFHIICAMIYLCNIITPGHQIKSKILDLIENNKRIPIYKIGFLNNWQNEPLWQK
ncbi:MAG: Abi family protein [Saprospiraceae bacterium]